MTYWSILLLILLSAAFSLFSVHWIFIKVLNIAQTKNLVDNPDARKLQKRPVPVMGGIAVFFGLLMGLLLAGSLLELMGFTFETDSNSIWSSGRGVVLPLLIAASILLYVGAIDDCINLSPRSRITIEVLTILGLCFSTGLCVDSLYGLWGIETFSWWIGIPLTVFASVGIINAFNMIDGVNGLSSSLCILVSVLLGTFFFKRSDWPDAILSFCFAGALIPFFCHNVFGKKSRMFIGDAGTMVMGLLVSWCMIKVLSSDGVISGIHKTGDTEKMCMAAMLVAIASVPVFDTLRVMAGRIYKGRSPFAPDTSHLHHKFIYVGVSHFMTTLSELVINIMVVAVWYVVYKLGGSQEWQMYATLIAGFVLVWGTYLFLRHQEKHNTKLFAQMKSYSIKTHYENQRWWLTLQNWLDKGVEENNDNEQR